MKKSLCQCCYPVCVTFISRLHQCYVPKVSAKSLLQVLHWFSYIIGCTTQCCGGSLCVPSVSCCCHSSGRCEHGEKGGLRAAGQQGVWNKTRELSWHWDTETTLQESNSHWLPQLQCSPPHIWVCLFQNVYVSFFTIITNVSKQSLLSRWRWNEL